MFSLLSMISSITIYILILPFYLTFVGSGIPCRIAFSYAGVRDIYLVAVAHGISGKLILAEKHPFRSQRGVVIAIAPLAGLSVSQDFADFLFPFSNYSDSNEDNRKYVSYDHLLGHVLF